MSTTEITPATIPPTTDSSKRRKAKAILAGGLVLGIGAAVTLAAWNDSEFVIGNFGTGHFDIEGSTDGSESSFRDHSSGSPASLTLPAEFPSLTPGETVAKPYVLRLDKDTDYDASISVSSSAALTGTTDNAFSYRIVQVTSANTCGTTTPDPADVVVPDTEFGVDRASTITLTKSTNFGVTAGGAKFLCIQVTAGDDLKQDTTLAATWEFVAESTPAT